LVEVAKLLPGEIENGESDYPIRHFSQITADWGYFCCSSAALLALKCRKYDLSTEKSQKTAEYRENKASSIDLVSFETVLSAHC